MTTATGDAPPPTCCSFALRLALAGVSATVAQFACQPIETVKIRLQLRTATKFRRYTSFRSGAQILVQREGVMALWKGMAPSALREMSYSSLRYGLFVPIKSAIGAENASAPTWKLFLAGGLSGGIGAAVSNPTDLLKARMQADASTSPTRMSEHARQILTSRGIRGFWLGAATTVSRAVVLGATNLGTYSSAKAWCARPEGWGLRGVPLHFCASVAAGFAIATTTAPIDFARSRIMVGTTSQSAWSVLFDAVRREGALAPYRGFGAQWARCAPYTVIQYIVWEQLCLVAGIRAV